MLKRKFWLYIAEFNRVRGDNIRRCAAYLERFGLIVEVIPHKTTLRIKRPVTMSWQRFAEILHGVIQPRRGSVVVFSKTTGRAFLCSNSGNRPGVFQRVM